MNLARSAGARIGDTSGFEPWLVKAKLSERGALVKSKLKAEFWKGVETGEAPAEKKASASKVLWFHGIKVWKDAEGWRTSSEPESLFDSLPDAKKFVEAQVQAARNPRKFDKYAVRDSLVKRAKAMGFYVDAESHASTGTLYVRLSDPNGEITTVRIADHGQVYDTADYSIDPENLTLQQVIQKLRVQSSGFKSLAKHEENESEKTAKLYTWMDEHVPEWWKLSEMDRRSAYKKAEAALKNPNVTDRALRYRANTEDRRPADPRICVFCGSDQNVEVGHLDGHEENSDPKNLVWNCRSCNTRLGHIFKVLGIGRRTRQYNPETQGAQSYEQYATALDALKGGNLFMSVDAAVSIIHATSPEDRSYYARQIWRIRKQRYGEGGTYKSAHRNPNGGQAA